MSSLDELMARLADERRAQHDKKANDFLEFARKGDVRKKLSPFVDFGDGVLVHALRTAADFVADIAGRRRPRYWLTLLGESGTGKTALARTIHKYILAHIAKYYAIDGGDNELYFERCRMIKSRDYIEQFKIQNFRFPVELKTADFLVIDDVGSESGKVEFINDALVQLFLEREGKWTVITSNKTLNDFRNMDMRVFDRFFRNGGKIVELNCLQYSRRPDSLKPKPYVEEPPEIREMINKAAGEETSQYVIKAQEMLGKSSKSLDVIIKAAELAEADEQQAKQQSTQPQGQEQNQMQSEFSPQGQQPQEQQALKYLSQSKARELRQYAIDKTGRDLPYWELCYQLGVAGATQIEATQEESVRRALDEIIETHLAEADEKKGA